MRHSDQIKRKCSETYGIHNTTGLKLLTRIKLGLSYLNDHKLNHILTGTISTHFVCAFAENKVHFFKHFLMQRQTLVNNVKSIDKYIINEAVSDLGNILYFGKQ